MDDREYGYEFYPHLSVDAIAKAHTPSIGLGNTQRDPRQKPFNRCAGQCGRYIAIRGILNAIAVRVRTGQVADA